MDVFSALGLTKGEEDVYRALIKLRLSSTGPIYKAAGVSQSKVYEILNRLKTKGLAVSVNKDGITHWSPANPQLFLENVSEELELLKKRKILLEKELPYLLEKASPLENDARINVGFSAYKTVLYSFLDTFSEGDVFRIFGSPTAVPDKYFRFLRHYNNSCAQRGIQMHLIYGKRLEQFARKIAKEFTHFQIRMMTGVTPTTTAIGNNSVLLITYKEPIKVISITSQELAKNYQCFFDNLWQMSEQI